MNIFSSLGLSEIVEVVSSLVSILTVVIILLAPIVLLIANVIVSIVLSSVATKKGCNGVGAFFFCFFFGLPGYIYVAALPDMIKRKQMEDIVNLLQMVDEEEAPAEEISTEEAPAEEAPAEE